MAEELSVVLLSWETRDLLLRSLAAALEAIGPREARVIVVDNGSTDGSVERVRERFGADPRVELVALERNTGPAHGFNVGLARSTGRYVLLLNTDAFLTRPALDALLRFLERSPRHGVAVPRLLGADGATQRGVMRFPDRAALVWHDSALARLWPENPWRRRYFMADFDHETSRDVDQPPQAVMLVRRAVVEQVGLLDETMPIYFNDVDWCLRIRDAGWLVRYVAEAQVTHLGGASARLLQDRAVHIFRDRIRYARKHLAPGGALLAKAALWSFAWCEAAACLFDRSAPWRTRRRAARRILALAREVRGTA